MVGKHRELPKPFPKGIKIALGVLAVAIALTVGSFYASGGRSFIIQTPSMATYAPVGTFVAIQTSAYENVKVGDTIAFKPPASKETYFHRVVDVTPQGLKTKGDLNGAVDAWTITKTEFIGQEFFHVPGLGFLLKVLPILLIAGLCLTLITRLYVGHYYRFPIRVLGWYFIFSFAAFISKPFFNVSLISQAVENHKATTLFVPTGLFGVHAHAVKGSSANAAPGQLTSVVSSYADHKGRYDVLFTQHLTLTNWIILVTIWCLPFALNLAYFFYARHKGKDLLDEEVTEEITA